MLSRRVCAFVLAVCHAVVAQQTLVVDPTGAGQFLTVTAALAAAGPGDTLFVRGGFYPVHHHVALPLRIVGDPTLPAPDISVVRILPGSGGVSLVNVRVLFAQIEDDAALDSVNLYGLLEVSAGNVVMTSCWSAALSTPRVTGGRVVFNDCTFTGRHGYFWGSQWGCTSYPADPALGVLGGDVAIANCVFTGGAGGTLCQYQPGPGGPGLRVLGGQVRATRSQFVAGVGAGAPPPAVSLQGGTFAFDPSTTFVGAGSPPGMSIYLPATDGSSASAGGTITATLQTTPGLAAILVASLGLGAAMPSFAGDVWFDPASHVVLVFGVTDASGQLGASIAVPFGIQSGTAITAQGGAISPTALTVAGTPVVVHVQ
jgi:hypothetical protein